MVPRRRSSRLRAPLVKVRAAAFTEQLPEGVSEGLHLCVMALGQL